MSGYRFCRTDDIGLLADALNRCWAPYFPDEPPMTPAAFKQTIRNVRVWCSSCMVALAGRDPVAVLVGARGPSSTLVHRIAVHPDHRRQGHGRHLLDSLASKLAILGPPRIVAEVPEASDAACGLFSAGGFVEEAVLTDYVRQEDEAGRRVPAPGRLVIPFTLDDVAANGLGNDTAPATCWERSADVLEARKDEIAGLAMVSDERIEACLLYLARPGSAADLVVLRSFVDDGGERLACLLSLLRARGLTTLRLAKVHPAEEAGRWFAQLGFHAAGRHRLYARACAAAAEGAVAV